MFVGCDANSKTRKRINVQCNAGLCWFSTHNTALTFPNIKTVISCIQMWDWVKIHYFCCTTYYSHWSLLNKVYHKLENYFQCAYKIVAAILHQCKRKTCCILQISLKKIFFLFFVDYVSNWWSSHSREKESIVIFSLLKREILTDLLTNIQLIFDLTTLPLWNRNGKNLNQTNKCYWKSVSRIE